MKSVVSTRSVVTFTVTFASKSLGLYVKKRVILGDICTLIELAYLEQAGAEGDYDNCNCRHEDS